MLMMSPQICLKCANLHVSVIIIKLKVMYISTKSLNVQMFCNLNTIDRNNASTLLEEFLKRQPVDNTRVSIDWFSFNPGKLYSINLVEPILYKGPIRQSIFIVWGRHLMSLLKGSRLQNVTSICKITHICQSLAQFLKFKVHKIRTIYLSVVHPVSFVPLSPWRPCYL